MAPTAAGKTEAVIAPLIERYWSKLTEPHLTLLYICPTRALVYDLYARLAPAVSQTPFRLRNAPLINLCSFATPVKRLNLPPFICAKTCPIMLLNLPHFVQTYQTAAFYHQPELHPALQQLISF